MLCKERPSHYTIYSIHRILFLTAAQSTPSLLSDFLTLSFLLQTYFSSPGHRDNCLAFWKHSRTKLDSDKLSQVYHFFSKRLRTITQHSNNDNNNNNNGMWNEQQWSSRYYAIFCIHPLVAPDTRWHLNSPDPNPIKRSQDVTKPNRHSTSCPTGQCQVPQDVLRRTLSLKQAACLIFIEKAFAKTTSCQSNNLLCGRIWIR